MNMSQFSLHRLPPQAGAGRARLARLLLALLVAAVGVLSGSGLSRLAYAADNPIVIENQQPGSSGWRLTLNAANDTTGQIKGYASATSVQKGESIGFNISVNPAQTYSIDIYRIGWYQGLGGRLMQHIGPLNGTQQPTCPTDAATGLIACNWATGYTQNVPTTWTSGIYLALLTNAQNYQNYIVFAVRDDTRSAPLLYQQSVTTYQAYNNYPDNGTSGKSLYEFNSYGGNTIAGTKRAVKVSFDRPYTNWDGAGEFFDWEIYFVRWLERSGYDVTYATDLDTHTSGSRLLNYRGFLSVGHDEYWSKEMRDAAEAARDAGTNLAFFGANAVYWQVRFEASASNVANRVMICYKDATKDPVQGATTTVQWRQVPVNRPEQTLIGVQFTSQTRNNAYVSYVVTNSSHWVYANTGFANGNTVAGILGYEADRQWSTYPLPNSVPGTYTLLSQSTYTNYDGKSDVANSSIYQAPSGAWVFGAGTIGWSWGLDNYGGHTIANARLQQTTANILNQFINSVPASGIAAPSNLSAMVASANSVNLSWIDNSANEDNFVIERSTNQTNWSILTSTWPANSSSYNDTVPSAGIYYYRVKATNAAGSSSNYSNTASADTQLLAPTGLAAASPTGYRVDLSWIDNATDETAYTVERSPNGSTSWTILTATLPANATSFSDTSVSPLVTYYYRVKSTNTSTASGYSSTVGITTRDDVPPAPSNLSATRTGSTKSQSINLSWIDNSSNEIGFVIERSTAANFSLNLVTTNVAANSTTYSDTAVQRSTTYYYRVKAISSVGSSGYSNVVSIKTR